MASRDEAAFLHGLARAINAAKAEKMALRRGEAPDFSILERARDVSTKRAFDEAREASGPATPYVSSWIAALVFARVNHAAAIADEQARRAPSIILRDGGSRIDARTLIAKLIDDDEGQRASFTEALRRYGDHVGAAARERWRRRGEIAARLGIGESAIASPLAEAELLALAHEALASTRDLQRAITEGARDGASVIALGWGREHAPSRLSARALIDYFPREIGLDRVPRLALGELPMVLGVASLARLLARLGARLADAWSTAENPPYLAELPHEARRLAFGATLASLPFVAPFAARALALSTADISRLRRRYAASLVLTLRLAAARVLLRKTALTASTDALREHARDVLSETLDRDVDGAFALVLPRLHASDPARLLAFGAGAIAARDLGERFDEDWFRNPKAFEHIEASFSPAAPVLIEPEAAKMGLRVAIAALHEHLA